MNRADRLDAIQRVARALRGRSWADVNLMLETFGFPRSDYRDWESEYEYAVDMLRQGSDDEALVELDAYLRRDSTAQPTGADEDRIWRPGTFRLFISHTSWHKARASRLASTFERLGVHAFVAHEAIEPTREWQDVIEVALLTCDALCAMLTSDFPESKWCDQEVGFAVAQRKLVLPLEMGADPHGFIGKYQAIPSSIDRDTTYTDIEAMLQALVRHPSTAAKAAPVAVHRYARSGSFDGARDGYELLTAIPRHEWTPSMIEEVDRAHTENSQLQHGNLIPSGQPIPEAVNELLDGLRPSPASVPGDDDIPF
jgi:hypothetical protein